MLVVVFRCGACWWWRLRRWPWQGNEVDVNIGLARYKFKEFGIVFVEFGARDDQGTFRSEENDVRPWVIWGRKWRWPWRRW